MAVSGICGGEGGREIIDSSPFLVYHSQEMGFLGLIIEGVSHPILDE